MLALCAALAALTLAPSAQASGYRTNLSKHTVHAMEVEAHLSGTSHGFVGIFAKTNRSGQVAVIDTGQIEHIPLSCTSGTASLGTFSLASVEMLLHVPSSGKFEYTVTFPFSPVTIHVSGKFTGHGSHVSGTAVLAAPETEFEAGETKGCRIVDPEMTWSAKPKWHKFVI